MIPISSRQFSADLVSALTLLVLWLGAAPAVASISFAEPLKLPTGRLPSSVAAADWNGDGALDLIVVNRNDDNAQLFNGDGQGGFQFIRTFTVDDFPQGVIAADFNKDSKADLATTARLFANGSVSAWLGNGDGTFQTPVDLPSDDGTRSVVAADIDGDTDLDLVVTNSSRGNISVFLGDGDGTFSPEIRSAVGTVAAFPTVLVVADFNEDGDLDVATSNAQSADASVGLLLGNGDGSFDPPLAFPTLCSRPESIATDDFDRDGHADLAVSCFFSNEIVVFLGTGSGGFAAPQPYSLLPDGSNPYWVLAEDFNRDGHVDLVSANNGSFSLLLGNGDGSFDPPQTTEALPGSFQGATAADLNDDGWMDLAIANNGQDELWVYLNQAAVCGGAPCPGSVSIDGDTLGWSVVPDAIGYDVVRGDLQILLGSAGDYSTSTMDCLVGIHPTTSWESTEDPVAGNGFWYLVRGVTAEGNESYDAFSGNLVAPRDAGIAASGMDCP